MGDAVLWVSLAVMALGLLGSVVPGLPGVPLIFLAAFAYAYLTEFENVGTPVLILLGAFAALAFVADFIGTSYGARRFGASIWGTIGGAIGGVTGTIAGFLFFGIGSLFGLILGTIGGVFLGEYLRKSRKDPDKADGMPVGDVPSNPSGRGDWRRASRAAGGVFVGYLISAVAQGLLAVASIIAFTLALIY